MKSRSHIICAHSSINQHLLFKHQSRSWLLMELIMRVLMFSFWCEKSLLCGGVGWGGGGCAVGRDGGGGRSRQKPAELQRLTPPPPTTTTTRPTGMCVCAREFWRQHCCLWCILLCKHCRAAVLQHSEAWTWEGACNVGGLDTEQQGVMW